MSREVSFIRESSSEDDRFFLLGVEYEGELSGLEGCRGGPEAIFNASQDLEVYDDELRTEVFEEGVGSRIIDLKGKKSKEAVSVIKEKVSELLFEEKFFLLVGGSHSCSIGALKSLKREYKGEEESFSVLQLDAHPDLFYSWNNSSLNHRCFGWKAHSLSDSLVQVGVRSLDRDEDRIISEEDILSIKAEDYLKAKKEESIERVLEGLGRRVYISLDVDVFDPSFIKGVGTPEPGGLGWFDVKDLLKEVFREKVVVGADMVEYSPLSSVEERYSESYALAKLAYKCLGFKKKFG